MMSYSKKEPQAGPEPTIGAPAPAQEKLPAGWTQKRDPSAGRPYYVNSATKVTTWDRPIPEGVPQPNAVEMPPEPEPQSAEEVQEEQAADAADPPLPPEVVRPGGPGRRGRRAPSPAGAW